MDADRQPERDRMVSTQIQRRGVTDPRVLDAMRRVPRHRFVASGDQPSAYDDRPLSLEHQQTISQPFIVALMSELAHVGPGSKVLEIGAGSGYQSAVLAEMGANVFAIEIVASLAQGARSRLAELGYTNVTLREGDGYAGWPEEAPFDAIVVAAAPPEIPLPLVAQLVIGGRLIVPVGIGVQDLVVVTRTERGFDRKVIEPVRFVPMTGEAQAQRRVDER